MGVGALESALPPSVGQLESRSGQTVEEEGKMSKLKSLVSRLKVLKFVLRREEFDVVGVSVIGGPLRVPLTTLVMRGPPTLMLVGVEDPPPPGSVGPPASFSL